MSSSKVQIKRDSFVGANPSPSNRRSVRMPNASDHGKAISTAANYASRMNTLNNYGDGVGGDYAAAQDKKIEMLEKDLERRQESYIARERAYKIRIDELEEELASQRQSKTGWMKSDAKMEKLKSLHQQIVNNVELVQDRTARIMQEQERDLQRAFRARLFDVQTELEKERSKKDDGAAAWIEKSSKLEAEVEWTKETADRLERVNQTLMQENNRLKIQFSSQEEDRNILLKQLLAVKRDNAKLRAEYTELEAEHDKLQRKYDDELERQAALGPPISSNKANMNNQQKLDSEERYKEINVRLRRLLAEERKSLQQVRQNYAQELKIRTEMEMLLRQCVEDVRQEIARRHVEAAQFSTNSGNDLAKLYSKQPGLIPVDEFTQEDRERVLELLLSQERVVSLIYTKTFPVTNAAGGRAGPLVSDNNLLSPGESNNMLSMLLDPTNSSGLDMNSPAGPASAAGGGGGLGNSNGNSRPHTASAIAASGVGAGGGGPQHRESNNNKLPVLGSRVASR